MKVLTFGHSSEHLSLLIPFVVGPAVLGFRHRNVS
jgi:hypothetical protein